MKWLLLLLSIIFLSCSQEQDISVPEVDSSPPSIAEEQQTFATIELTEKQVNELNLVTETIKKQLINFNLIAPGTVYPAPDAYSIVSAPISGRISKIFAHEGEFVSKGQVLAELQSLEYSNMISDYLRSKAENEYYKSQVNRLSKLAEKKISPEAELEKVKSEYQRAKAIEQAAFSRLLSTGLTEKEISEINIEDNIDPVFKIKAPISGVINEHMIELGQSVEMYQAMLDIIDEKQVLIKGFLSPDDAQLINPGDTVISVSQQDNSNTQITALVKSISPALDETNKSVIVNINAYTKNSWPRPGENVRLKIKTQTKEPLIAIPMKCITYDGDFATVFVKLSSNRIEKRMIKLIRTTDEIALVADGLKENEEVVTNQIFSLKALDKFNEFAD